MIKLKEIFNVHDKLCIAITQQNQQLFQHEADAMVNSRERKGPSSILTLKIKLSKALHPHHPKKKYPRENQVLSFPHIACCFTSRRKNRKIQLGVNAQKFSQVIQKLDFRGPNFNRKWCFLLKILLNQKIRRKRARFIRDPLCNKIFCFMSFLPQSTCAKHSMR